ncbi:MAG TPA: CinA family protein [Thermodesulfovibrionales bacterium]|jgi:PncC family amidohydrolase|nr:CinA family protein [Thermodesulfovibrionales bacterium]
MKKKLLETIEKIHALFKQNGFTLSVAESCTGGFVSHLITTLPGASNFFEAGVVSYSADAKKSLLRVSPDCIAKYGVVSEQTAREMAEKIRRLTKTDFSLSTTGNLGPDVLEGKEKGLVYIAVSKEGMTFSKELRLTGNREENKKEAALGALRFLIEIIEMHQ